MSSARRIGLTSGENPPYAGQTLFGFLIRGVVFDLFLLKRANAEKAYFMSDSSTWIMEKGVAPDLTILYKGDKFLVNTYHAITAPPGATPGRDTAEKFVAFVASPAGQKIIGGYGRDRFGEGLYNDEVYARQYDK